MPFRNLPYCTRIGSFRPDLHADALDRRRVGHLTDVEQRGIAAGGLGDQEEDRRRSPRVTTSNVMTALISAPDDVSQHDSRPNDRRAPIPRGTRRPPGAGGLHLTLRLPGDRVLRWTYLPSLTPSAWKSIIAEGPG